MFNIRWLLLLVLISGFRRALTVLEYCDEALLEISGRIATNQTNSVPIYRQILGHYGGNSPRNSSSTGKICLPAPADNERATAGCGSDADFRSCSGTGGSPWIALLRRGMCPFEEKINNSVASGASAVIIYNQPGDELETMLHPRARYVAVLVSHEVGQELRNSVLRDSADQVFVKIRKPDSPPGSEYDAPVAAATVLCAAVAIALNVAAIVSIRRTSRTSHAAHSLFLINLLVTDAAIGAVGGVNLCVLYTPLHDPCRGAAELAAAAAGLMDDSGSSSSSGHVAVCVSRLLVRFTDVLLYSNLLSILLITGEQLVACCWPLRHRACVTRRSAAVLVAIAWALALLPELATFALELRALLQPRNPAAAISSGGGGENWRTLCELLLNGDADEVPSRSWHKSLATVVVTGVALAALVAAYIYIMQSIGRYGARTGGGCGSSSAATRCRLRPAGHLRFCCCIPSAERLGQSAESNQSRLPQPPHGASPLPVSASMAAVLARTEAARRRRRGSAAKTSCLLVGSFALSYTAHMYVQGGLVAHRERSAEYTAALSHQMSMHLPIGPAVLDVLLCGVLGAILDPIIYCVRRRRVKAYLSESVHRTVSGTLQLLRRGSSALSRQGAVTAATSCAAAKHS